MVYVFYFFYLFRFDSVDRLSFCEHVLFLIIQLWKHHLILCEFWKIIEK